VGEQPTPALLTRFRDGDREAFAELFRSFHALTRAVAARYFRDELQREEAVQEIWLTLHRRRRLLDPSRGEVFRGFLAATARNRCLDLLRSRNARPEAAEIELPDVIDDGPPPDEALRLAQLTAAMGRFKAGLEPALRRSFELLFEEELEPLEAGRREGLTRIQMRYRKRKLLELLRADAEIASLLGRPA
jgi:RNA polymerase sigma-70 factor (ECF subfamily)